MAEEKQSSWQSAIRKTRC